VLPIDGKRTGPPADLFDLTFVADFLTQTIDRLGRYLHPIVNACMHKKTKPLLLSSIPEMPQLGKNISV
jgi:hypothetical protein